jgi:hypothetical protein
MQLFISISINTLSPISVWQQVGDQLTVALQTHGLSIMCPARYSLGGGHNYEAEGWIFLKPGNLTNGRRIMKSLTIPECMIDLTVLQGLTKHIHNTFGIDPVIHIGKCPCPFVLMGGFLCTAAPTVHNISGQLSAVIPNMLPGVHYCIATRTMDQFGFSDQMELSTDPRCFPGCPTFPASPSGPAHQVGDQFHGIQCVS